MKRRFYYGTQPTLSNRDKDSFSQGKYQCQVLLTTKKGQPVVISRHKDLDIWMVGYGFSTVYFGTKAEALAYCKGRFRDLDGQAV